MGIVTNQSRLIYLTIREDDIKTNMRKIDEAKINMLNQLESLQGAGSGMVEGSPELELLHKQEARLKLVEQKLDIALEQYKTELSAINSELQAANQLRQEGSKAFNYMQGVTGGG